MLASDPSIDLGVVTFSQRHVKETRYREALFARFVLDLREYLLHHVRSLKTIDMIGQYVWKDFGINWR